MTQNNPTTPAEYDETRIIKRPDGFWWQARDGGRDYGPFPSLMEAVADMQAADDLEGGDDVADVADAVHEAEDVLGVPDWIDPETGQLADDERTRTEDH
ncbi:hypothetical protein M6I34_12280 [Burkholderiaceae bacterium FT117]|uniref:hypothetical protein n=1 Tax=Zeimonas sediminis TaxID=2944268 RepID=UPI002342C764|nr:hypothetical protein [Zeimonas sediminis]MCM5571286.1 hypothetical protein [Zeimonas sediminis]